MASLPSSRWRKLSRRVGWASLFLAIAPAAASGLLRLLAWLFGCQATAASCTPLGLDLGPLMVGSIQALMVWLASMALPLLLVAGVTLFAGNRTLIPRMLKAGLLPPLIGLSALFTLFFVGASITGPSCVINEAGGGTCVIWGADAGESLNVIGVMPWLLFYLLPLSFLWAMVVAILAGLISLVSVLRRRHQGSQDAPG